jgi:ParB family chromosome partitioning protein
LCYLDRPRFSGGAYHPILRRADQFLKTPLQTALGVRQERAKTVMELDDLVVAKVEALKSRGLTSPYLKSFVVARINPIRFRPKDAAPLSFDEVLDRMTKAAAKVNVDKVKLEDLARSGGAPED